MADEFHPSEHTAAEVQEHLASADDAERQRVLDLESQDKSRKSVMAAADGPSEAGSDASDAAAKAAADAEPINDSPSETTAEYARAGVLVPGPDLDAKTGHPESDLRFSQNQLGGQMESDKGSVLDDVKGDVQTAFQE